MHYYRTNRPALLGDTATVAPSKTTSIVSDINSNPSVKLGAGAALVYHGYKRTGSIFWALAYGVLGRANPLIGGAVAAAQGFGHKKGG